MAHRPRRPAIISQLLYLDPDGAPDPAATTDCGESCVSSILATDRQLRLSPGCIRQAWGKPASNGSSTAHDITWICGKLGLTSSRNQGESRVELQSKVAAGWWAVALGEWIASGIEHWMLFYDFGPQNLWAMDPWNGKDTEVSNATFDQLYAGTCVFVQDKHPRTVP